MTTENLITALDLARMELESAYKRLGYSNSNVLQGINNLTMHFQNPELSKAYGVSGFVAHQTFLIEAIDKMFKDQKSIVREGFIKISMVNEYKCSDPDLAKYRIEYKYPLHLIHFGYDLHKAELNLSIELKRKWGIR